MAARKTAKTGGGRRSLAPDRGVFMISVAAELAEMHPQTLRIYEQRGLITPQRSPKNTRLYSQEDVEQLRRIQHLVSETGMNLAGVERVLALESDLERVRRQMDALEREAEEMERRIVEEVEAVRRSFRRELVPYHQRSRSLVRAEDSRPGRAFRIPVSRGDEDG